MLLTPREIRKIRSRIRKDNERLPVMFQALGDPGRFRIFRLLMHRHDICVTDVASLFGVSVSAASQQLKILERTGLVHKERMGRMLCYEVRNGDPLVRSLTGILIRRGRGGASAANSFA